MASKQFKTLDEQIDILINRGVIVSDIEYTKDILLRENYFFIAGYRHLFLKDPKSNDYRKGTTFDELYSLFKFDRNIRNIFFKNLLIIENNSKSIFSYHLSKRYGIKEKDYLNASNFTTDTKKARQVSDVLDKIKRQVRVNGEKHTATMHYMNNYGYIPMWILIKVLSFGMINELYAILKVEDQVAIAKHYGLDPNTMQLYLTILSNYRNLCAHEDIMFENKTDRVIPNTTYHYKLNIPRLEEEFIYGVDDLYAVVIILKELLTDDEFIMFMKELQYEISFLECRLNSISINKVLNRMGFPNNYFDIVKM